MAFSVLMFVEAKPLNEEHLLLDLMPHLIDVTMLMRNEFSYFVKSTKQRHSFALLKTMSLKLLKLA